MEKENKTGEETSEMTDRNLTVQTEKNDIVAETGENKKNRKVEWNREYTTIAVYALIVILFAVVCVFFFLNYNDFGQYVTKIISVFNPIFYGIVFAYLLNAVVVFFENKVFGFLDRNGRKKLQRALSIALTVILVLLAFSLVIWILVPQVIAGYKDLEGKMSFYIESVQKWLANLSTGDGIFTPYITSVVDYINNLLDKAYELIQTIIPQITTAAKTVVVTVKDVLLGFIFAIYFLFAKERLLSQIKKFIRAISSDKFYNEKLPKFSVIVNEKFGDFLRYRIVDAVVIGVLCFFGSWAIGVPYYPLVSLVVGFSNIVPIFGPIVSIIVTGFIVFITSMNPAMLFWYLLVVILLHFIYNNFIRTKFRNSNIGLSPTCIFVAVIVMTGFFGIAGTLLGVPTFAVLYDWLKTWSESRLKSKGESVDTRNYCSPEGLAVYEETLSANERKLEKNKKIGLKIAEFFKKAGRGIAGFFTKKVRLKRNGRISIKKNKKNDNK